MEDLRLYWVALNLVKGIGSARLKTLLDAFGDAQSAWEASPAALRGAGLPEKIVNNLLEVRAGVDLQLIWKRLEDNGVTLITWLDDNYPRRLKEIDLSPPVLYVRGTLTTEDDWTVAVVGTRRITKYGRQATEELGAFLARNGITVVSGLARGVDGTAHQAALDAGGRTIAVLGSGVNQIYPAEHRRLAEQIMENGALVSDYPLDTPPEAGNFPARNRIISGLSLAVVVVEAGATSGALITAEFAAEQGREVFAVPGTIYAKDSRGANRLIQQGAFLLQSPEELLEVLQLNMLGEQRTARTVLPADANEARLFEVLGLEPMHVDEIRAKAEMPIEQVSATLTLMELKGLVRQVGSMHYVAVRELKAAYETENTE